MSISQDDPNRAAARIRLLQDHDAALPRLAVLIEEMQAHYEVPCPARAEIIAGLQARPQGAEILVAEREESVIALCAFSAIYPGPGLNPGIFLKELYVGRTSRGLGVGRSLMRELAALAGRRGLSRIDWTADAQDDRLLAFYDEIGGVAKPEKLFYRLDGEALARLGDEAS
ncbi:GNAT family N-acetyltransferase [Aliirhizobium cellulosilyticum]|uniref:GNAT superfamily N-acetyltransferase n=1 Tax=Aliirhizobium cellulosilyticum TaxID=393664 RepID=A0A7W6S858_9HYPH|nr:GNAT family N-acetyltransferase [Rhizobium cellulosilyticum]MBB4348195.1 GNAT superfamily N-acetyltransferase [Rhizobium cellulosilyticum]MBB4411432.1 GNAT superfamily N-acetyltransferase [Rhizobium cellulosilyticum]MBB4446121.1 GNAT superfamily N-acetyltransferase [Rhizobium cellulosilyticum]